MSIVRQLWFALVGFLLLGGSGCSPQDPGAGSIPEPIVTPDAPKTSGEAAAQEQAEREKLKRPYGR